MLSFGKIEVKENVVLAPYTSYKIGGPAEYFFEAKNKEDFIGIIKEAQKIRVPFLILGQGTNVLISDKGVKGLVIINRCQDYKIDRGLVYAESGVLLPRLVRELAQKNLGGLEFLANIPGTIGGAIVGNAGSYGKSISDILKSVEIILKDGKIKKVERDFLEFSYRDSRLKKEDIGIILLAELMVKRKPLEEILQEIDKDQKIRELKHPRGASCGSFFKNIDIKSLTTGEIEKFKDSLIEGKISVAKLIESCGLKSAKIGDAQISEKHSNFIINLGKAKCSDILRLTEMVKREVYRKFDIRLEEEIKYLGKF